MLITPRTGQAGEVVLEQLADLERSLLRLQSTIARGGPGLAGDYSRWANEAEELFDEYSRRADVGWLLLYCLREPMTAAPQEEQLPRFQSRLRLRHAALREAAERLRAELTRPRKAAEELLVLDTEVYLHAPNGYVEIDLVVLVNQPGSPSRPGRPLHVFVPIVVLTAAGERGK